MEDLVERKCCFCSYKYYHEKMSAIYLCALGAIKMVTLSLIILKMA